MNSVLSNILETGLVQCPDGQIVKAHSAITRQEGEFLQNIIDEAKPRLSLEIGLAYGVSSLFICDALARIPGARHIIVDPAQFDEAYWKGAGLHNLRAAGYGDMIEFYDLPSHIALPRLESDGRQIEFAFIDGAHLFDFVLVDFFCVDRILKVGGIVAFDDLWMPSVQRLCRYIITNRSYKVVPHFAGSSGKEERVSWKRRLFQKAVSSSEAIRKTIKPEYAEPRMDFNLGGGNRCVAFRKEAADSRAWDFHHDF
ncbi:MAG TPA: class I SAM-dependent methyltransferase [Blastocatellia bacterium]|nr:class I SAM-dependent methyltransferase [Blastocatellia bacterium]